MSGFSTRFQQLIFLMLIVAVAVFYGQALAQESAETKTLVVIGSAEVHGGNVQAARERAIKDGLVSAVAQMTKEILQVEALVDNFQQLNQLVYDQPDKYIQNYKVLTETGSGKVYRVAVEVNVAGKRIAQGLSNQGILRVETKLPSVVMLIAEQNVNEILPQYWWGHGMGNFKSVSEQAVAEILKSKGFNVIEHRGVQLHKLVDWVADTKPELSDEQASELGAGLKADVVVVGVSSAGQTPNIMGYEMKSFKGNFSARVLMAETGEKMITISKEAVATNADEHQGGIQALSNVGTVAGETLAEQLAVEWRKFMEKPTQVEIIIEGTSKLANFVKFRKALSSVSGVEGIYVKEIKPNEATLIVDFKGKPEELASALMLNTFETFGIDIYEIAESFLKIALIPG